MNKRIFLFMILLITSIFVLSACKDNTKKELVSFPYPTYSSFPSNWEEVAKKNKIFLAKFDGELHIFFVGNGVSRFGRADAQEKAQLNAVSLVASAIKEIVKIQFYYAETKGKTGNITSKVKRYIETRFSNNVNVSGLVKFKVHFSIDSKNVKLNKALMVYGMPYELYRIHRNQALAEIASKRLLSSRKFKLLNKDLSKLDSYYKPNK